MVLTKKGQIPMIMPLYLVEMTKINACSKLEEEIDSQIG